MGQITFTNQGQTPMNGADGSQSVTLQPGGSRQFSSACSLVQFINANHGTVFDNQNGDAASYLNSQAEAEGCPDRVGYSAVPTSPTAPTGQVGPGGDSPQQQGAPSDHATGQVSVQNGPYGEEGDTRQPTQAMHDRENPQSAGQIRDGEQAGGATPQQADDAVTRAQHGDPPAGQQRATHSGDQTSTPSRGGDPVDLFSGQLALTGVDLDVPAPYIPIQLQRSYLSGLPYWGPWGFNWDHNWNVYLRELDDGRVTRWNGRLHEDVFVPAGAQFEPPRGVFESLEAANAPETGYRIRAARGIELRFDRPVGWSDGERIPLVKVTDRADHSVILEYDSHDRLSRVLDEDGRGLIFHYGTCGLLEGVEDHAGRLVHYMHDPEAEHLTAVVLPATKDFPEGHTTGYEYDRTPTHPAMRHNVLRVFDHDRNAVLVNEYGSDPTTMEFNRVVRQLQGGYFYAYQYEQLQWVASDPAFADVVTVQTCAHMPDLGFWTYSFNYAGELLDERVRLKLDRSFRVVASQRGYDSQGNLVGLILPDGSQTVWTYDDTNLDPRGRGNLLKVELRAPPEFPEPSRIVLRVKYEPQYQLIREQKVETGARTRLTYDFDLAPAPSNRGDLLEIEWPEATLPDGSTQTAVTHYEYDAAGRLSATITPEGHRDELVYHAGAGTGRGFLEEYRADVGGANERTLLAYDGYGFPAARTDPGGAYTELHHNALGELEEQVLPAVAGIADRVRYHYNAQLAVSRTERPRGEYTDALIADDFLLDTVSTNPLGQVLETVISANSADPRVTRTTPDFRGNSVRVTDAAGVTTQNRYDERGLLLESRAAAGTPDEAITSYVYDLAGRIVERKDPGGRITRFEYDAWGRIARQTMPAGTVVRNSYGPLDLPTQRDIVGDDGSGGAPRVLARVRWEYDERARCVRTIIDSFDTDPGAAVPLAEQKQYDRDGRCTQRVAPGGGVWAYDYDGRGRLVRETDPDGNTVETRYGPDGLPSRQTTREHASWGTAERYLDYQHDGRKRLTVVTASNGATTTTTFDARDLAVQRQDPTSLSRYRYGSARELTERIEDPAGLALTTSFGYDAVGRPLSYRDPTGEETVTVRDRLGRPIELLLADGNRYAQSYNAAGDIVTRTTPDGSSVTMEYDGGGRMIRLSAAPSAGRAAVPDHLFAYDGLDRIVRAQAGVDTIERHYDSLARLIEESSGAGTFSRVYDDAAADYELRFPHGRRERHSWDLLGRVDRIELAAAGSSPPGPAGTPGDVLLQVAYLGRNRIARLDHITGVVSEWRHDDQGQLVRVEHTDAGGHLLDAVRYRYDTSGRRRVKQVASPPAENDMYSYDARGRLTEWRSDFALAAQSDPGSQPDQDSDIAAAEIAAATAAFAQRYQLDGGDTRTTVTTDQGGIVATAAYIQSPGHEVTAVDGAAISYDGDGCRTSDPDRRLEYDALGRAVLIRDGTGANILAELAYDPAGRLTAITSSGATRRRRWFGSIWLQEEDGTGTLLCERIHHPLLISPSLELRASGLHSLHADGHESLLLAADSGGTVAERYRYDAFGQASIHAPNGTTLATSAIGTVPVFAGMEALAPTGLFLTPRRLYDPATGLFLARDPYLHLQTPNPYLFALHDPVLGLDPSGEIVPWLAAGLIVGAIGAVVGIATVVMRGGDYDWKDVAAAGAIGFGAGFIAGATFGAASSWAAGALLPAAGGAAATATGGAATGGLGVSLASGAFGGAVSGGLSGTFSGAANASYRYARHGGDYWSMVGHGVYVEGLSGAAAGMVGGALFQGASRLGTVPQGAWASLRTTGPSTPVLASTLGRGLLSPYGLGAPAMGFASGWSGGLTRHMLEGESFSDAADDAVGDAELGAFTATLGTAVHPTTWRYWSARVSPEIAASIENARAGGAHHQRSVALYPEFATSRPNTGQINAFWRWYGNNVIRGNLEGPFSEYNDPAAPYNHQQLHGLWRFGQTGNWSNWATHGPWTPAWNVNYLPEDPRAANHDPKPEGSRTSSAPAAATR